jgi:prepilin-type N-terminal cleavage/methylation domain-containing protein
VTALERAIRRGGAHGAGFTLLEVLVALAVVGIAVAGVLQLASQSLRLLKLTSEHVAAVNLADRLARESSPRAEGMEHGDEGPFTWERRMLLVETPKDLDRPGVQNAELYTVAVSVRWSPNRVVEVATLRTAMPGALESTTPGQTGPPPGSQVTSQGLPGQSGRLGAPQGPPGQSGRLGGSQGLPGQSGRLGGSQGLPGQSGPTRGLGLPSPSGPGSGPGTVGSSGSSSGPRRSTPGSSGFGGLGTR